MEVSHTAARSYNTGALTKLLTDIDGWRATAQAETATVRRQSLTL